MLPKVSFYNESIAFIIALNQNNHFQWLISFLKADLYDFCLKCQMIGSFLVISQDTNPSLLSNLQNKRAEINSLKSMSLKEIRPKFITAAANTVYNALDWHISGRYVAYAAGNQAFILDHNNSNVIATLKGHGDRANTVRFLRKPKELTVLSAGSEGSIVLWNSPSPSDWNSWKKKLTMKLDESVLQISFYELSETEFYLIALTTACSFALIHVKDDKEVARDVLPFGTTFQTASDIVRIDETNFCVFVGGIDCKVHVYTFQHGTEPPKLTYSNSLTGHENAILDIKAITLLDPATQHQYTLVASASKDTFIRVWKIRSLPKDADPGKLLHEKNTYKVKFPGGGLAIVTVDTILSVHSDVVSSVYWGALDPLKSEGILTENDICLLSSSFDFTLLIWSKDPKEDIWYNRSRLGQIGGNKNAFFGAIFNNVSDKILAYTYNGAMYLWEKQKNGDWKPRWTNSGHFSEVSDIDWSSEGDYLLSTSQDQTSRIFTEWKQAGTWHEVSRVQIHGYNINTICNLRIPSEGDRKYVDYVVSGADEKIIRLFEPSLAFINTLNSLHDVNLRLFFEEREKEKDYLVNTSDGKVKYKVSSEGTTQVLGLMIKAIKVDKFEFNYGPEAGGEEEEGGVPVGGDEESKDNLEYDFKTPPVEDYLVSHTLWPEFNKLYGHGYELSAVAANHAGTLLASSCKSQDPDHSKILLWDPKKFQVIDRLPLHNYTPLQLEFSPNDEYLLSASKDRQFGLWRKTSSPEHPYELAFKNQSHTRVIWSVSFSHDSKFFATGSRDKTIKIWEISGNKEISVKKVGDCSFSSPVTAVAFAKTPLVEGKYLLAIGLENGALHLAEFVKEAEGGKVKVLQSIHEVLTPAKTVTRIRFSRVSKEPKTFTFASASQDHSVRVFDVVFE